MIVSCSLGRPQSYIDLWWFWIKHFIISPHTDRFRLKALFVLCPQLGQDLLVAGLPAGDPVKVTVGGFADRHALGGKGSADVAEIAFVLRSCSIFLGSQSSHINNSSYNLNTDLACQVASFPQVTRKLVLSSFQDSTKLVLSDVPSSRSSWTVSKYGIAFLLWFRALNVW